MVVKRGTFDPGVVRTGWHFMVAAGALDALGTIFFAGAAAAGRMDVAAVLGSLYPAFTVLLAWMVLKEHLTFRQWTGVVAAVVALALISS